MFLPAYRIETAPDVTPTRTAFVLHGILGSLRNWRTMARRIAAAHPDWRMVLVDLRNHGDSDGAPAPHTLDACADDLVRLAEQLDLVPEAVIGHSFGGKVALAYGRREPVGLAQLWVLDSAPGPVHLRADDELTSDVVRVIEALADVAVPLESRADIIDILTRDGFTEGLAQWMTTNLKRDDGGYTWRFDLDGVRELLADYAREDLVPWVNDTHVDVHFVWAGKSGRNTDALLKRLEPATTVTHHVLENAGHWLHVDDPEGLVRVLGGGLV